MKHESYLFKHGTTHNAKEIAECFCIDTSIIYRLEKRVRETGSVDIRLFLRERKPSLSQTDIQNIGRLIQEQSDITIHEIPEKFQLHISDKTVRKAVLKLEYVHRMEWQKHMLGSDADNLVFLDESGVSTNMTRHYARSKTDERTVYGTPVNVSCSTTLLSSIRRAERHLMPLIRVGQQQNALHNI